MTAGTRPAGPTGEALARGARLLDAPAAGALRGFVAARRAAGGGFRGRGGGADVYFTGFGLALERALGAGGGAPADAAFVRGAAARARDLPHLVSAVRALALLGLRPEARALLPRVESLRAGDGGYRPGPGGARSTAYAGFLAALAYETADAPLPRPRRLAAAVRALAGPAGGFRNHPGDPTPTTPATAAAVHLAAAARVPVPGDTLRWLLARACPGGGFLAGPAAPGPDLLSSAVALLALAAAKAGPADPHAHLAFVESCWRDSGGFASTPGDPEADLEYAWYALLALGSLAA